MISKKSLIVKGKWLTALGIVMMLLCVYGATGGFQFSTSGGVDNFDLFTKIVCSNGNTYEATFANLQIALNASGVKKVLLPGINMTTTGTIWVPDGVSLYGIGRNKTVFWMADGTNRSMIRLLGNNTVYGITFDQNCWGHDAYAPTSQRVRHPIVSIYSTENVVVEKCVFKNAIYQSIFIGGQYLGPAYNITIKDSYSYSAGAKLKTSGKIVYHSNFLTADWVYNISVLNCHSYNSYSGGFVFETGVGTPENTWTRDFIVDGCTVDGGNYGFYTECAKNGMISNSRAYNILDATLYGYSVGFWITANSHNIVLNNCIAVNSGTGSSNFNINNAKHITLMNCISIGSIKNGFLFGDAIVSFIGCTARDSTEIGIGGSGGSGYSALIVGCTVSDSGTKGIYIYTSGLNIKVVNNIVEGSGAEGISAVKYTEIFGNTINDSVSYGIFITGNNAHVSYNNVSNYGTYGILFFAGINNCTVNFNRVSTGSTGIRIRSAVDCTVIGNMVYDCTIGIEETTTGNFNIIKNNNVRTCITKIARVGANTIVKDNIGYYTENSGSATTAGGNINHNLSVTPRVVIVTPSVAGYSAIVTAISSTTFTVNLTKIVGGAPASQKVYWSAFY